MAIPSEKAFYLSCVSRVYPYREERETPRPIVDPETVQRARRGDAAAVEALARALTPELWRLAVRLCGDRALAEDLVTEALYRGIVKLRKLREETAVRGWFRAILVHRWRDVLRRRRKAPLALDGERATLLVARVRRVP